MRLNFLHLELHPIGCYKELVRVLPKDKSKPKVLHLTFFFLRVYFIQNEQIKPIKPIQHLQFYIVYKRVLDIGPTNHAVVRKHCLGLYNDCFILVMTLWMFGSTPFFCFIWSEKDFCEFHKWCTSVHYQAIQNSEQNSSRNVWSIWIVCILHRDGDEYDCFGCRNLLCIIK